MKQSEKRLASHHGVDCRIGERHGVDQNSVQVETDELSLKCNAGMCPHAEIDDRTGQVVEGIYFGSDRSKLDLHKTVGSDKKAKKIGEKIALNYIDGLKVPAFYNVHPKRRRVIAREINGTIFGLNYTYIWVYFKTCSI